MNRLSDNDRLPLGTTVATIGMFDGVHLGHATLVQALKQEASRRGLQSLVVTFGQHPQHVLQHHPELKMLQTLDQRLNAMRLAGKAVKIAGISLGIAALTACHSSKNKPSSVRGKYIIEQPTGLVPNTTQDTIQMPTE